MSEKASTENVAIEFSECAERGVASSVLVLLPDEQLSESRAPVAGPLSDSFRTLILRSPLPDPAGVEAFVPELLAALRKKKIKKATVYGRRRGAAVALALAVADPKIVRRLVVVDAAARMVPNSVERVVDWVEQFLPLGLPLRNRSLDFDARPLLHRVHCPTLVLSAYDASHYLSEQCKEIARRIPNAWLKKLTAPHRTSSGQFSEEMNELLHDFLQIPVKRSQRTAASANTSVEKIQQTG